jgi:hypothetical protein
MVNLKVSASKIVSVQYRLFMDGHYLSTKDYLLSHSRPREAHLTALRRIGI